MFLLSRDNSDKEHVVLLAYECRENFLVDHIVRLHPVAVYSYLHSYLASKM